MPLHVAGHALTVRYLRQRAADNDPVVPRKDEGYLIFVCFG